MMKKRKWIILLVVAALCAVLSISPTLGQQIPFNEWAWNHYPVHKIRYYMSESLVEKLNTERPDIVQTANLLGHETMGGHQVQTGDTHIIYFLGTPSFLLFGMDMYTLEIDFKQDGAFQSAKVVISD